MKTITSLDEYYSIITTEPYNIIIFSAKHCAPCQQLKTWVEKNHPKLDNVYYIDVYHPDLEAIVDHVESMPTVILYKYTFFYKKLEGYNENNVSFLFNTFIELSNSNTDEKPEITIL